MIYNNNKLMFFILTIISTMLLISSHSWLNMWMWLEINLISFITFLINKDKKMSIEASLIYFLIQTIASIIFLFSIIMLPLLNYFNSLIFISLMLKIGSAPLHYWLILMIEGLNWMDVFILLTWQKINPLIMLFYMGNYKIIYLFIMFSTIMGSIFSLNFNSIKKIMVYSSINQLSWIFLTLIYNKLLLIYLIMYFFLLLNIIYSLNNYNIKFMNQFYKINFKKNFIKMFMFMNFLSMGGLPPFLGFFPKMLIMMKMNNMILLMLMLMMTLIMLFMYMRIIFSILILNSMKINILNNNINNEKYIMYFSMINNLILVLVFFYF